MDDDGELKVEAGKRLRQIRVALGYASIRRFAENTGVTEDNLSNWERGISLVPAYYVQKLKELFGVTHDFIYGSDAASLKHELAMKVLTVDKRLVT